MLTALTPLGLGTLRRRHWVTAVTTFTLAGMATSALVGAGLAGAGRSLHLGLDRNSVVVVSTVSAVAVVLRELRIVRFRWPQPNRASNGRWGRRFGVLLASLFWGVDIGAYFTTWMTYLGAWWLAEIAVMSGNVTFAMLLLMAYWAGRTSSVWLGPWIAQSPVATPWIATVWVDLKAPFRIIHAGTVVVGAAAIVWNGAM